MNIKMNFEHGQLSQHLTPNNNLFATTATIINNLNVMENGGLSKRAGLKYLAQLDGYGKLIPFNENLVAISDEQITLFNADGKKLATATAPYFMEHIDNIDYAVNNNKLYLAEKHYNLVIVEFTDEALSLKEQTLEKLNENPAHITFYENRLVIAGTNINPSKIYMSKIGDYFNFDIGTALPDDAIELLLTSGNETIMSVVAGTSLEVFTIDSEWKITGSPMIPQTVSVIKQSSYGSSKVKPVMLGGMTIFIPKKKGAIRNFIYSDVNGGYISQNLCEYAPHLLDNICDMTMADNKIFLLTTTYMITATILKNHLAFTKTETDGIFISCASIKDKVFFIVKRNGNFLLETFDNNFFMDSFVNFNFETPTKKLTGLSHLKNMNVMIMTEENFYNGAVDDTGNVELLKPAKNITIGIPYEYILLPNNLLLSGILGNNSFKLQDLKLFIKSAKLFKIDTGSGFEIIDFQYDLDTYDYTATRKEIKGMIKITGGNWNFDSGDHFFLLKATNPYDFQLTAIEANILT